MKDPWDIATAVALLLTLYGLCCVIKPFGFVKRRRIGLLLSVVAFIAAAIAVSNTESGKKAAAERATERALDRSEPAASADEPWRQEVWINRTKDAVRSKLRDPDSAKFRNLTFHRFQGAPIVCGEVNSKNGFGGMTGYQGFIGAADVVGPFLEEQMEDGEWPKLYALACQ
jgi:hypothetical protein